MARVALVTGGTRGIGHAISIALKNKRFSRRRQLCRQRRRRSANFRPGQRHSDLQVGRVGITPPAKTG